MKKRRLACSDDDDDDDEAEAEVQSLSVSSYHLVDDDDVPVSFSVLPIQWGDSESAITKVGQIFLHGLADNGLQKIFMQVTAWRFDVSYVKPKISLLSKDGRWIRLQKPRKSFLDTVRTILITLHFLHRVKKNPRISATSLWSNLLKDKDLSSYGFKPSRKDLLDHMPLIGEAAKRDAVLAQSKLLLTVLGEKPGNQKLFDKEVKDLAQPGFIVDGIDNDMIDEANEDSEAKDICVLCDNGGNVVCCDGACMRSFHGTKENGRESMCDSLGFTQKEVDEIQSFYCKNCEYNLHQCFACGKLGSSDKAKGAKVIKCASATCGRFYHPHCVAKLLPRVVKHVAEKLERNIADGDPFTCPIHYCCVCKELENKMEPELQLAVCRRCPKSYHRKCLPREIAFDGIDDEDIVQRAWEGLLPNNRILIYCLNHEMDDELGTPIRDHIKFPDTKATVREINSTNKRMKPTTKERVLLKKNNVRLDNSSGKSTAKGSKETRKLSSSEVGSKKSSEKISSGSNISRKLKSNKISRRCLTESKKSISKKFEMPDCEENKSPVGEKLCALVNKDSKRIKHDNQVDDVVNETLFVKPIRSALPPLDADSKRRLEGALKKHMVASTHTRSLGSVVEKTITMGKLEGSIDAVRTALRKLEGGRSIQDVKAVCDPDVPKQIFNWKDKRLAANGVPERVPDHSQPNPIDGRSSVEGLQPKSVVACAHVEVNDYGNLEPISDFGRSYSGIKEGPSFPSSLSDCGVTNIEEHHSREEEKYRRESDIRQQVGLFGVQDPDSTRNDHLSGRDPSCGYMGYSYAQISPVTESSYEMNTPAMERYAPRADELNLVRMSSLGSEPPTFSRSGTFERSVPLPGFAPGRHHLACSPHNSAGWLDE